jgi:ATP-grasp domain
MILIDKPYASDFLIKTIEEKQLTIVATDEAKGILANDSLNWISEEKIKNLFSINPNHPIYTNSENAISWIEKNLGKSKLPSQINIFKNKIKFRELLKDYFPHYYFKAVSFDKLSQINIEDIKFPFIIKPAVGFFSLGVHKVDGLDKWEQVLTTINNDIEKLNNLYPKEVIDTSEFIIEECIEGDEYAIDCYYNTEGEPVILNILHHLFSSKDDVNDRVYSTSKNIIEKYYNQIFQFLKIIGEKVKLKNFPAHVEIRINENGDIIPIEVNPLRFGGWCTTGDLSWYAYGFNSYEYFLSNFKPNWENILEQRKDKIYSIIVLDNNSGLHEDEIEYFDYDRLMADFENPIILRKINFKEYHFFGFLFCETTTGNEVELTKILNSNLTEYIVVKS